MPARILVVDDRQFVRYALRSLLAQQPHWEGGLRSGKRQSCPLRPRIAGSFRRVTQSYRSHQNASVVLRFPSAVTRVLKDCQSSSGICAQRMW
jgi:hypothetical protein